MHLVTLPDLCCESSLNLVLFITFPGADDPNDMLAIPPGCFPINCSKFIACINIWLGMSMSHIGNLPPTELGVLMLTLVGPEELGWNPFMCWWGFVPVCIFKGAVLCNKLGYIPKPELSFTGRALEVIFITGWMPKLLFIAPDPEFRFIRMPEFWFSWPGTELGTISWSVLRLNCRELLLAEPWPSRMNLGSCFLLTVLCSGPCCPFQTGPGPGSKELFITYSWMVT